MLDRYNDVLEALAQECYQLGSESVLNTIKSFPEERFFAAGFHTLYIDGTYFGGYRFGLGSDSANLSLRWSGAEWAGHEWGDIVDFPAYERLSELLDGQPDSEWDNVQRVHDEQLSQVCRRLTQEARGASGAFVGHRLPDFIVGIFDDTEGKVSFDKRVRMSVTPENVQQYGISLT